MRSILLGAAAAVLGFVPVVASAVPTLQLNTEGITVTPNGADQTVFVEVFGTDVTNENELLNVFTIAVNGVGFGANSVRFTPPAGSSLPSATYKPVGHKYVFRDQGFEFEPSLSNFGSTVGRFQFGADVIGDEDVANLTDANSGFIRLPVLVPANALPGRYPVVVDIAGSQLGGAGAPITILPGIQGYVDVVPEPASLGLLVLGGLLTLRRRRLA